jgi:hypothetical protein
MVQVYPNNWKEIATGVKQRSGYCCERCQLQCLTPGYSYRHLSRRIRGKLTAQVHHIDRQPTNNNVDNLIALCPRCHLDLHRGGHGNITPGQMTLSLGVRARIKRWKFKPQLSFAIDLREPLLDLTSDRVKIGRQLYLML